MCDITQNIYRSMNLPFAACHLQSPSFFIHIYVCNFVSLSLVQPVANKLC